VVFCLKNFLCKVKLGCRTCGWGQPHSIREIDNGVAPAVVPDLSPFSASGKSKFKGPAIEAVYDFMIANHDG